MKRSNRKSFTETPDTSISRKYGLRPQNLATHDRVELLQTVFSVLKPREIKAMAPSSVRDLPLDSVKELCLDELLGISTKRLCAVLDGKCIPSDTESSSESDAAKLDNVSLESISSDEGVHETPSDKDEKHKHCKRRKHSSKGKEKVRDKKKGKTKDKMKDNTEDGSSKPEMSVGPTVLELLELQARARAIRAQLDNEHDMKKSSGDPSSTRPRDAHLDSDDDIEIKEEPQEIVELSSDEDRKPDPAGLEKTVKPPEPQTSKANEESSQTVTRRNDFTIIVPKSQSTKKIKLNRQKSRTKVTSASITQGECVSENAPSAEERIANVAKAKAVITDTKEPEKKTQKEATKKMKTKRKKKLPSKSTDFEESDHDEISLQLSDTEKMDLLDDIKPRSRRETTLSSADSESSSDSSDSEGHISDEQGIKYTTSLQNEPETNSEGLDQITTSLSNEKVDSLVNNETVDNIFHEGQDITTPLPENEKVKSADYNGINDNIIQENEVDVDPINQNLVENHFSVNDDASEAKDKDKLKNDIDTNDEHRKKTFEPTVAVESTAQTDENNENLQESTQYGDNIDSPVMAQNTQASVSENDKAVTEDLNTEDCQGLQSVDVTVPNVISSQDYSIHEIKDTSRVNDLLEKEELPNDAAEEHTASGKQKKAKKNTVKKKEKKSKKKKNKLNESE